MSIVHRRCVCRRHERYARDEQRQSFEQSAGYYRCRQCQARDRRSSSVMNLNVSKFHYQEAATEISRPRRKGKVKCRYAISKSVARARKEGLLLAGSEGFAPRTPMTPSGQLYPNDRRKESPFDRLPLELLVRIVCSLHHDQLKPAFHVCRRFRQAVLIAQESHFDFRTPNRERQVELELMTPRPNERWPFASRTSDQPTTPMAPRHAPRPPQARIALGDLKQVAANLFPGDYEHGIEEPRPAPRAITSHRVLFTEEELCQAVANNTLELL
ncbi:F-box protein At4g35930 [Selaginella moellendorffii]|nr:F-box protein At4g35930 [Selaginella moellendorffii]|eukprot:XP_002989159.2 F-box protein At4g35930 [Selaginella moellendorffii]